MNTSDLKKYLQPKDKILKVYKTSNCTQFIQLIKIISIIFFTYFAIKNFIPFYLVFALLFIRYIVATDFDLFMLSSVIPILCIYIFIKSFKRYKYIISEKGIYIINNFLFFSEKITYIPYSKIIDINQQPQNFLQKIFKIKTFIIVSNYNYFYISNIKTNNLTKLLKTKIKKKTV